ncbi:tryptophan synthase beta subunit-like PLP-dependent enzyme [Hypoxylon sp. FL1284]|nr:tryptophan synthase beta subunit-like PLP-dependent enzyme [Hypoxylon sp. FL1284]
MSQFVHLHPSARDWEYHGDPANGATSADESAILAFHKTVPDYNETPLHSLPDLAADLGLAHVLLKDESNRFGLPAFKILGASWAVHRAVSSHLGLPADAPPAEVGGRARHAGVRVVTATEGNCGRAVARAATRHLGLPTRVYVPALMDAATRRRVAGEGAEVREVEGAYDDAIRAALADARARPGDALLVLDVGVEGCDEVPRFFVQGYGTMLAEAERQVRARTGGRGATHAVVPVGAGSVGEAVAVHFKGAGRKVGSGSTAAVLAVEPTTADCLMQSLRAGRSVSVPTEDTIMCGMNCGTLSTTAWPVLRDGVDAAVTVTDLEAHEAVEELKTAHGILAGPCGAATLAALRRACKDAKQELGLDGTSVVVLYCTEGQREYSIPS